MRRVLVTGASRGIGLALVKAFLARGDQVYAAARSSSSEGELSAIRSDLLTLLAMDVSSDASVALARKSCRIEAFDLVINNAGLSGGPQAAPGFDLTRVEQVFEVNAVGAIRVYDAFVDLLRNGIDPWLINVSSEAGSLTNYRLSTKPEYAMSKAALNSFTRWVAGTEAGKVRSVSIDPGWTMTAMGGAHATRTPDETAALMVTAYHGLNDAHNGGFFNADLSVAPW